MQTGIAPIMIWYQGQSRTGTFLYLEDFRITPNKTAHYTYAILDSGNGRQLVRNTTCLTSGQYQSWGTGSDDVLLYFTAQNLGLTLQ